jgi:serine/threonine protein kinase
MAKQNEVIDGIAVRITDANLGVGGQGAARKAVLANDPDQVVVLKYLPPAANAEQRSKALVSLRLSELSPFLAAPLAVTVRKSGKVIHLSPFAEGKGIEEDRARSLPELLEICHLLACLLETLEERGLAHGDLSSTNIRITKRGDVFLIDFDNFASTDPGIPKPTMIGQHLMMAPELRSKNKSPTMESDRYTYGVVFSTLLLGRHPAVGLAANPAEVDHTMTSGIWPERSKQLGPDELPLAALGQTMLQLMDQAFLLEPAQRPAAADWRRAFQSALSATFIHDCGQAFVLDSSTTACPVCGGHLSIPKQVVTTFTPTDQMTLRMPATGQSYKLKLQDGKSLVLGRSNLPGASQTTSGSHLEVTPYKDQLLLRHIGRNPTLIQRNGQWYRLEEYWLDLSALKQGPLTLRLAETEIIFE